MTTSDVLSALASAGRIAIEVTPGAFKATLWVGDSAVAESSAYTLDECATKLFAEGAMMLGWYAEKTLKRSQAEGT